MGGGTASSGEPVVRGGQGGQIVWAGVCDLWAAEHLTHTQLGNTTPFFHYVKHLVITPYSYGIAI